MSLPCESPLRSFWTASPYELRNHRTTQNLPSSADVVVIGSGYTGATSAYFILEKEADRPSTVILEAREACSGASGRNGGHLKPDPYFAVPRWERMYGRKVAKELLEFELRQVWDVKKLVERENIDCDFELTRAFDVFTNSDMAQEAVSDYQRLRASGFEYPNDLHVMTDKQRAERICGVKGALVAFSFTSGSMWVLKLVSHLLSRCLEWGANLQTNTPALSISDSRDNDGYYTVVTSRGEIRAKKVVVASNAYTEALLPEFKDKIVSMRGVAARIAVPPGEGRRTPHLNNSYLIRFGPQEYDYLISRSDGSIVVGGAKQTAFADDSYWHKNSDDSSLIPGAKHYFDGYMQRTFNGWENCDTEVTHVWTGAMGFSEDLSPFVGELPSKPGIYVAAGFTAHGMPKIYGCSEAIAMLVRGKIQHISAKEARIPAPLWIMKARMESNVKLARTYMAGIRPRAGAKI